jgi:Cell division protein anillin
MEFFERATEGRGIPRPLSCLNIFPGNNPPSRKPETSNSDNNPSHESSQITTSTPKNKNLTNSKSSSFGFWQSMQRKVSKKVSALNCSIDNLHAHQKTENANSQIQHQPHQQHQEQFLLTTSSTDEQMKDMQKVFHDLDTFIEKELNDIQVRKRIDQIEKQKKKKLEIKKDDNNNNDEKFFLTLQSLKDEVRQIKENQKLFESKMKRQSPNSLLASRKKLEYGMSSSIESLSTCYKKQMVQQPVFKKPADLKVPRNVHYAKNNVDMQQSKIKNEKTSEQISQIPLHSNGSTSSLSSSVAENARSREEKLSRLENELYKAETLMMKITRVLENVVKIDEENIDSIINIERHYLVASTRFQSSLNEIRKINDNSDQSHQPPFHRKGKLVIRDVMLEVKSAYFQRRIPTRNEYLLVMIKYNDRVMASNAYRISDDIRVVRFTENFSIPEAYADFEMRLEVYGTTFWRKTNSVRETMLKKYGFVTFTLADTGKKHKRFNMIEVMQAENVPIRSKVLVQITQKITVGVQYRGLLFVKIREVWYETSTHLNGHILEISFKRHNQNSVTQSRETILLDLYNYDSDAVIPVDTRVSKRQFTFSLKFNHYVDVANF